MHPKAWSDNLINQTRQSIEDMFVSPADGCLHFKHIDGAYGAICLDDLFAGRLQITEKGNQQTIHRYSDVNELLQAGWVID